QRFCTQALFEASHILIEPRGEEPEAVAAAQAAAEAAIAALADGRAQFADLAKELSDCPSGALGGSLGQLQPGDVVSE
ncbi:peptidylprolyl isomerase, partial [Mycobacterium riyadhense]